MYHESLSRASGRGRAAAGSRRAASPRSLPSETSADGEQRGGGGGVYRRGYGSLSRSSSLHEEMSIRDILAVTPEDLYREDSKSSSDREWIRHALMTRGFKKSKVEDAVHRFKTYRECLYDLQPKLSKYENSTDAKVIKKYLKSLKFAQSKIDRAVRTKLCLRDCLHLLEPHMITVLFPWDQRAEIDAEIMANHPDFGWSKATVRGLDQSVQDEEKVLVRYETFFGDDEWLSIESRRIGERKQVSAHVLTRKITDRIKSRGKKDVNAFLRILKALQPDDAEKDSANGGGGEKRERTRSHGSNRRDNLQRTESFSSSTTSSLEGISFLDLVMGFGSGGANSDREPSRSSTTSTATASSDRSSSGGSGGGRPPSMRRSRHSRTSSQTRSGGSGDKTKSSQTHSRRNSLTSMSASASGKRSTTGSGSGGDKRHSRSRSRGRDRKRAPHDECPSWNFDEGGDCCHTDELTDDDGVYFWDFLNTALEKSCELTEHQHHAAHDGAADSDCNSSMSSELTESSPSSSESVSSNASSRSSINSRTSADLSSMSSVTAYPPFAPTDIRIPAVGAGAKPHAHRHGAVGRHSRVKSASPTISTSRSNNGEFSTDFSSNNTHVHNRIAVLNRQATLSDMSTDSNSSIESPLSMRTEPAPSNKQIDDLLALVKQQRDEHLTLSSLRTKTSSSHRRTTSYTPSSIVSSSNKSSSIASALNPLLTTLTRQKHSQSGAVAAADTHPNGIQTPPAKGTATPPAKGTATPPSGGKVNGGVPRAVSSHTTPTRKRRAGLFGLRKLRAQTVTGNEEVATRSLPTSPNPGPFTSQTVPAKFVLADIKDAQQKDKMLNPFDEQAKELGLRTHRRLSVLNDPTFEVPEQPQARGGFKRFFKPSKKSSQPRDDRHKLSPAGSSLMNVAEEMAQSRTSSSTLINELERHIARKKGVECFRKHLEKEASEENLDFVMEVSKFRAEMKQEEVGCVRLVSSANILFKKFIEAGAEDQINLSWGEVKRVRRRLDTPEKIDYKIFDEARHAIMHLMAHDSFRRYIRQRVQARRDHSKHVMNVIDSRLF